VVDHQSFSFNSLVVKVLFGTSCWVWWLEANESIHVTCVDFHESDTTLLNFSVWLEIWLQLLLIPISREVLYIEVASLLGLLVSQCISKLLFVSVISFHGSSDIKLQVFSNLFTMKTCNCCLSTLWTIVWIVWNHISVGVLGFVWIVVANKSEFQTFNIFGFADFHWFNLTELWEHSFNFLVSHGQWNVFDINIVDQWEDTSGLLDFEVHTNGLVITSGLGDSFFSWVLLLIADKSISSWGSVIIVGYLQTFDSTEFLEFVVQILMSPGQRDASHEDVVVL